MLGTNLALVLLLGALLGDRLARTPADRDADRSARRVGGHLDVLCPTPIRECLLGGRPQLELHRSRAARNSVRAPAKGASVLHGQHALPPRASPQCTHPQLQPAARARRNRSFTRCPHFPYGTVCEQCDSSSGTSDTGAWSPSRKRAGSPPLPRSPRHKRRRAGLDASAAATRSAWNAENKAFTTTSAIASRLRRWQWRSRWPTDSVIVREGVARVLAAQPDMEVVVSCGDLPPSWRPWRANAPTWW